MELGPQREEGTFNEGDTLDNTLLATLTQPLLLILGVRLTKKQPSAFIATPKTLPIKA